MGKNVRIFTEQTWTSLKDVKHKNEKVVHQEAVIGRVKFSYKIYIKNFIFRNHEQTNNWGR